ncbi:hypothetical protein [Vaginella massiliensis]|uniref:hypothetical protein n=1 Tax=Vaginella massiliensis TaxID=1816680 RepID=UPI0008389476|nr:hypothetical protein [Vaginella massiliensis]
MGNSDLTVLNEYLSDHDANIDVHKFVVCNQLIKRNDRYCIQIKEYDFDLFVNTFKDYCIEDLELMTIDDHDQDRIHKNYQAKFADFVDDQEFCNQHQIINFSGYFTELDFYFFTENEILYLHYIENNKLQFTIDQMYHFIPCELRNRLITQLLINIRFEIV